MTPTYNIITENLPTKAHEAVVVNPDGSYTIILNARLTYEAQCEACDHALKHIYNNDFEKFDVQTIEMDAHYREE